MIGKTMILLMLATAVAACGQKKKENSRTTGISPRAMENAVIYEVNIRQFTPEGTLNAFARHLPRLKELGVDVIWLMPVYPISEKNRKGSLGSYYAVQDYRKVNPAFGTLEDLKAVVKTAHDMGFRVIFDWVANHTGWDNPLLEEHPEWYTQENGAIISPVADWSDVADLNFDNKEMREYMIESLEYWVKEADIDGYRCDMAAMVPTDFWETARVRMDSLKPLFMLAEAWEPELTATAFDAVYGWDFHHLMNDIAQGKKDGTALAPYFAKTDSLYPRRASVMNFLDNHDENSWNGTIQSRMGEAQKAFAVLTWTVPGIPLIYTGQEAGLDRSLDFFEKNQVDWTKDTTLSTFYRQLNDLKHDNKALSSDEQTGAFRILPQSNEKGVFAFERQAGENRVAVVLNLTGEAQETVLETPLTGAFTDYFTDETTDSIDRLTLQPYAYRVFTTR